MCANLVQHDSCISFLVPQESRRVCGKGAAEEGHHYAQRSEEAVRNGAATRPRTQGKALVEDVPAVRRTHGTPAAEAPRQVDSFLCTVWLMRSRAGFPVHQASDHSTASSPRGRDRHGQLREAGDRAPAADATPSHHAEKGAVRRGSRVSEACLRHPKGLQLFAHPHLPPGDLPPVPAQSPAVLQRVRDHPGSRTARSFAPP